MALYVYHPRIRARELGIHQFKTVDSSLMRGIKHGYDETKRTTSSLATRSKKTLRLPMRSYVNITLFEKWRQYTQNANRQLEQSAKDLDRPMIRVNYEDFNQRPLATVRYDTCSHRVVCVFAGCMRDLL